MIYARIGLDSRVQEFHTEAAARSSAIRRNPRNPRAEIYNTETRVLSVYSRNGSHSYGVQPPPSWLPFNDTTRKLLASL